MIFSEISRAFFFRTLYYLYLYLTCVILCSYSMLYIKQRAENMRNNGKAKRAIECNCATVLHNTRRTKMVLAFF